MTVRIIEIANLSSAEKELLAIGSEKMGVELMVPKAVFRCLKLKGLKPTAANIIKQETLSLGGEAAVAQGTINQSIEETDVLIFGTFKQIRLLIAKLKLHQFGLPKIAVEIEKAISNYETVPKSIKIGSRRWDLGHRTYLMGILNVTPDSFSDGGKFLEVEAAVARGKQMILDGADLIDVGGESTRPGSKSIDAQEEKRRVIAVIEKLAKEIEVPISIDTTKSEVAKAALAAGASMINDISGLHFDPNLAKIAAEFQVPICLMHIKGVPQTMQQNPEYQDLMGEIIYHLTESIELAKKAGIAEEKIIVDPGIGFGKTVEHNLEILKRLRELKTLGRPILVGPSRKSVIGKVLDLPVEERLEGTAATVALAIASGADFVRVHDVKQMTRVTKMADAVVRR